MAVRGPAKTVGLFGGDDFDRRVERFEAAWRTATPPDIVAFLPAGPASRRKLLHELIKIDLEYRWRRPARDADSAPAGGLPPRPRLEDYAGRLPELGPAERLPIDLIAEEFRVRQHWGDRPSLREYRKRFPRHRAALHSALDLMLAELSAEPAPDRLGRYELHELLGTGGFGSVWRAWDTELVREVAVKLPRPGKRAGGQEEERFLREARSAAHLNHSGIVGVYDVGSYENGGYIVSELVRGPSLADWLRDRRPDPRESAELVARVADALDYAHRQGVVHRDLKPANILLGTVAATRPAAGEAEHVCMLGPGFVVPKIADFGLALRDAGEATVTVDGQVLGTPAYMSPEQVRNPHAVDGRSDVYSLGVILYELLAGELPFRGAARTLLAQVASQEPRPPRLVNDRVPAELEAVCLKCLAKEPGGRYPTARALAADLRRWLAGGPVTARPPGTLNRLHCWTRRHVALALAAGMAVVTLAVIGAAPLSAGLVAVAAGSVALAVYKSRQAAELALTVLELRAVQRKSTAALRVAVDQGGRGDVARNAAAEARARRCEGKLRDLSRAVIVDLPAAIHDPAGPARAQALLVRAALAYLDGLVPDIGDDVALRELALDYLRVADVQWSSASVCLGDRPGALASCSKGVEILAALAAAHPQNAQAQRDLTAAYQKVGEIQRSAGRSARASGRPARLQRKEQPGPGGSGGRSSWELSGAS